MSNEYHPAQIKFTLVHERYAGMLAISVKFQASDPKLKGSVGAVEILPPLSWDDGGSDRLIGEYADAYEMMPAIHGKRLFGIRFSQIDHRIRGEGLGQQMYLILLYELSKINGVMVPNAAYETDGTSVSAIRVWKSLARYPGVRSYGGMFLSGDGLTESVYTPPSSPRRPRGWKRHKIKDRHPMPDLRFASQKYEHIDFRPPEGVAAAAEKGLDYRQRATPSNRGGLTPAEASKEGIGSGVQRATNLKNRDNISPAVIRQMHAFFARHEKNKDIAPDKKSTPWNDKGYVAWLLWGGDPGKAWAAKIIRQMDAADEKAKTASIVSLWIRKSKLRVSPNWVSDPTSKADKDDKVRMWDLYSISYGGIGGQATSISSLMEQFDLVMHRDMDGDGEIDAFIGFKQTHAGNKLVLMGSDGTSRAKRDVIMKSMSLLKSSGWYAELSGKPAMLALQEGVPVVEDEQLVREVLRKPLDWHGGSYTRVISGLGSHKKWLFGRPNMSKSAASGHDAQVELMKFMSRVARRHGVAKHIYIVGGAVRNFVLSQPIKDVDVVVDSVALGGKDSEWFASLLKREIPAATKLVTNQYGVAIITVTGTWQLNGADLTGEVIEIANARKESYGGGEGKGYKPSHVVPATIEEDVLRREFNFNTLLWSLMDLTSGPDKAEIIDLTGCGMQDLRKGIMQCPRDPDIVFSDDPTRMLRAIKFMAKYGFKIPADVADSIKRNARKMKSVPWEAIATLFVQNVLNEPTAEKALRVMKSLGLLDVVGEMADATPAFHTYLTRELRGRHASLLLELLDLGFTQATPLKFLTPAQRGAFLDMARGMDQDEVNGILRALEKPEIDNQLFIREYNLQGPERSIPLSMARELILGDPSLANRRDALNQAIRLRLVMR